MEGSLPDGCAEKRKVGPETFRLGRGNPPRLLAPTASAA